MKNVILASTSTLYGEQYLDYIKTEVAALFAGIDEIVFIPFARPGGITHEAYTKKAADFFTGLNIKVVGLDSFKDPKIAIQQAEGFFTGGGNTFLLTKTLHEKGLMGVLKQEIEKGKPYLGASAGTNIAGQNIRTTNDMPIVYPPSFDAMGIVPFNINPHYLDPHPELKHNGETRETRLLEFLTQNDTPVVGLREGSWIRIKGNTITLEGTLTARIFETGKEPYEMQVGKLQIS
ncbi:MAG: dipeptidase PepE [Niabella sp.]